LPQQFDPENRLTAYGTAMTAGYRGDGLRAWKESNGTRTYFLYDGSLPVYETDLSDNGERVNTFGAAGLVSRHEQSCLDCSGSAFYTFDSQGNVSQSLNFRAQPASSVAFDAHGSPLTGGDAPWGYGAQWGYYTDGESGLLLLTHRYYDPQAGRFLTRDPISYNGGVNLYAYVRNAPINYIDPLGQDLVGVTGGAGAGAAVGGLGLIGTVNYSLGYNLGCRCNEGEAVIGGAGSAGFSAGENYSYPSSDTIGGGLGATFGAGAGGFWSNAVSFKDLAGPFETTIIATPLVGIEIDKSGDTYVVSVTAGKGWGGGIFHLKTNTPNWTTWESGCVRVPPLED
jgi:RHS repeat-associated protein